MQDSDQRRIVGILFSNLQLTAKIGEGEFGMSTGRNLQLLHTLSVANHNDYYYEKTGNNQVTLRWSVKPCEAKTESDGKPILVKIYKARDPLGILDTKRLPHFLSRRVATVTHKTMYFSKFSIIRALNLPPHSTKIKLRTGFVLLRSHPLFQAVRGYIQTSRVGIAS
ncbi:hypothetical protein BU17DRAFT_71655 [Hysterangium stoloniferum]|nr:hypothetical protein BU17DRAFT_71655 [Hysterangium stoloniferum]